MSSNSRLWLVAFPASVALSIACVVLRDLLLGEFGAPLSWLALFSSSTAGILLWLIVWRSLLQVIIAIVVAFLLFWASSPKLTWAASLIGLVTSLWVHAGHLIHFPHFDPTLRTLTLVDLLEILLFPVLMTELIAQLRSNRRWSGP